MGIAITLIESETHDSLSMRITMKQITKNSLIILLATLLALSSAKAYSAEPEVSVSYLYNLSNFTGTIPTSWVDIAVDSSHDEVYIVPGNTVRIFNNNGMEVFSFNEGGDIEGIADVAVDDTGNIVVVAPGQSAIIRCNYRGEPIAKMELKNLPKEFSGFSPNRIFIRKGSFYFASLRTKQVVVADQDGNFKDGYDVAALIKQSEEIAVTINDDIDITGFSVDQEGNILFTIPVLAKAFVLTPDKQLASFGTPGSTAGRFGVVAGIAADASGKYILVADTLRCVVMVFDRKFRFYTEFGFRGLGPGNLVGPMHLAVDNHNKVYVSQLRNRGVSVYQIEIS